MENKKIPPWSASSLAAFQSCPHKYYRIRVLKDVKDFPPSDAILLGQKLHKAFENAVNLDEKLPGEFSGWSKIIDQIKAFPGEKFPEFKMAVDKNFKACDYKDPEAFSRGIADLVIIKGKEAIILDYKTGKRKESNQLDLYAAYAFEKWPELEVVSTAFVWLKSKQIDRKVCTRANKHEYWNEFLPIVRRLEHAYETGEWEQIPSGLCNGWCPVMDCKYQKL